MKTRTRALLTALLVFCLGFVALANFVDKEARERAWWLPDQGLRLGLDLRGGVHLVLGPDLESALSQELASIKGILDDELERKDVSGVTGAVAEKRLRVTAPAASDAEVVREITDDYTAVLRSEAEGEGGTVFTFELTDEQSDFVRERALQQVLEVLRRRIDDPATGIPESVITRQGRERVLVQIPGVEQVPTELITGKGFLEFKIVEDTAENEEILAQRYPDGLPEGMQIATEVDPGGRVLAAYLVPEVAAVTGDLLNDAFSQFDQMRGEWRINFTWSERGAEIFDELTGANIGRGLAILLDGRVQSAPVIRARIRTRGEISGNFTQQEAAELAIILRAGSLPIDIRIEEERTVGPALGRDSIDRGLRASLIGLLVIVMFGISYYRLSGIYASLGLFANLLMLLGLMSLFRATLTLPGIAGLVLTIGMAVDANVIIFERIREEIRQGRATSAAVAAGFQKARWTILDANITTLVTAIILFEFGTGPIKGFAVTLSVGILTSVFSALVITRLFYAWRPGESGDAPLSI